MDCSWTNVTGHRWCDKLKGWTYVLTVGESQGRLQTLSSYVENLVNSRTNARRKRNKTFAWVILSSVTYASHILHMWIIRVFVMLCMC